MTLKTKTTTTTCDFCFTSQFSKCMLGPQVNSTFQILATGLYTRWMPLLSPNQQCQSTKKYVL